MPTYLERYRVGEREQVWGELVAFGSAIRAEPLYADAQAVAREMMLRARYNVAVLVARLQQLDYQFANTIYDAWLVPDHDHCKMLGQLEKSRGPLPLVLRCWSEMVGTVDLRGAHPKLSAYAGLGNANNTFPVSDPLFLVAVPYRMADVQRIDAKTRSYALDVAPDACLKANTSGGGESYSVIPNAAFDAAFVSEDWWDSMPLIPYLRECFAWGGFPRLQYEPEAAATAQEELAFLTKDLLPI